MLYYLIILYLNILYFNLFCHDYCHKYQILLIQNEIMHEIRATCDNNAVRVVFVAHVRRVCTAKALAQTTRFKNCLNAFYSYQMCTIMRRNV